MEHSHSDGKIGFRALGSWSTYDLSIFSSSVGEMYEAFLIREVRYRLEQEYLTSLDNFVAESEQLYAQSPSWVFSGLGEQWKKEIDLWKKYGILSTPLPIPPFSRNLPFPQPTDAIPSYENIHKQIRALSTPDEWLRIHRVRISSPGGFSFTGIGEIIKELRELIKDIWYRNKQEKALGELQIIFNYLEINRKCSQSKIMMSSQLKEKSYLAKIIQRKLLELKSLEEEGKIDSVPENLDYVPE